MSPDLQTALSISAVGLVAVFSVLSLVALVVKALTAIDGRLARAEVAAAQSAALVTASAPAQDTELDDLTLVLITAACATVVQGRFRVRQITRVAGSRPSSWTRDGRAVLHGSHVLPKPKGAQ